MLQSESLDALSREFGVEIYRLEQWRDKALTGMDAGLKDRQDDPLPHELDAHRMPGPRSTSAVSGHSHGLTVSRRRVRGPKPKHTDEEILKAIRADLELSPFSGEGHRPVNARLRILDGIRVSRKRVLWIMRENQLLPPHRVRQGAAKSHDGKIITLWPNLIWGGRTGRGRSWWTRAGCGSSLPSSTGLRSPWAGTCQGGEPVRGAGTDHAGPGVDLRLGWEPGGSRVVAADGPRQSVPLESLSGSGPVLGHHAELRDRTRAGDERRRGVVQSNAEGCRRSAAKSSGISKRFGRRSVSSSRTTTRTGGRRSSGSRLRLKRAGNMC
jgi:hypothetical protein